MKSSGSALPFAICVRLFSHSAVRSGEVRLSGRTHTRLIPSFVGSSCLPLRSTKPQDVYKRQEQDGIVTVTLKGENTYIEQAKYVIDCEGVVGTLKRKLLGCDLPYITTYQTYNQGSIDLDVYKRQLLHSAGSLHHTPHFRSNRIIVPSDLNYENNKCEFVRGKTMYNIIVIGAGPTGSTAAKVLAEKGYKVLLVEKFKIPRYKSCSGQLIKKTIDLVQAYFGEAVPADTMCVPIENKGMIFTNDKGKSFRFEQDGLNVWRSSFDKWLADKAEQSGVEVRDNTTALSCEEQDGIVTVTLKGENTYIEQAKYVIDCEGVVGTLKRKLLGRCV